MNNESNKKEIEELKEENKYLEYKARYAENQVGMEIIDLIKNVIKDSKCSIED